MPAIHPIKAWKACIWDPYLFQKHEMAIAEFWKHCRIFNPWNFETWNPRCQETTNQEANNPRNQEYKKPRNQTPKKKTNTFHVQVRESPAPLKIPTPTPATWPLRHGFGWKCRASALRLQIVLMIENKKENINTLKMVPNWIIRI